MDSIVQYRAEQFQDLGQNIFVIRKPGDHILGVVFFIKGTNTFFEKTFEK